MPAAREACISDGEIQNPFDRISWCPARMNVPAAPLVHGYVRCDFEVRDAGPVRFSCVYKFMFFYTAHSSQIYYFNLFARRMMNNLLAKLRTFIKFFILPMLLDLRTMPNCEC
jgi:hypothetical protein